MVSLEALKNLPALPLPKEVAPLKQSEGTGGFAETLKDFVGDVNQMQLNSADKTMKFATGEIKDLHQVMAASEEASISLMMLMEVRNKALDAYRELMRIPV